MGLMFQFLLGSQADFIILLLVYIADYYALIECEH